MAPRRRSQPARSLPVRVLMAVVGVTLFLFYLVLAAGVAVLLGVLFRGLTSGDAVASLALVVVLTLAFVLASYRFGTARLLATLDATELSPERAPELYRRVGELAAELGVEPPAVAVARMEMPNALAVGGGGGTLVLDGRLFRLLDGPELEGILAHELVHLASRDGLVQTLAYSLARSVVGLLLFVLFPVTLALRGLSRASAWLSGEPHRPDHGPTEWLRRQLAGLVVGVLFVLTLVVRAHSRRREYRADQRAATLTGRTMALARALRKIERASRPASGLLATLYIHAEEDEDPLTRLLSTHPPMDERVERLASMADDDGPAGGSRRIPIR